MFSCSKDGTLKYWDADTFEEILEFADHFGDVWGLCVSQIGDFVVSVGADTAVRVWQQTQEQMFLVEEKEKRLEKMMITEGDLEYTVRWLLSLHC